MQDAVRQVWLVLGLFVAVVLGATGAVRVWAFPDAAVKQVRLPSVGNGMGSAPGPAWLAYVNTYRALANLPALSENPVWSDGDWKHARYMVKNDVIGHNEDSNNAWYTAEGNAAAQNGNVMLSSNVNATDTFAIDLWMRGPFHALGILDPHLLQTGFGSYRESIGTWHMGAALDVLRGRGAVPASVSFPVEFPGSGQVSPLLAYIGSESPDPLASCPGYAAPTGAPILLQIAPGTLTPNVTGSSFRQSSMSLPFCIFDETNFNGADAGATSLGRSILHSRSAIVLIPRAPLAADAAYTVSISSNGQTYGWVLYGRAERNHAFVGFEGRYPMTGDVDKAQANRIQDIGVHSLEELIQAVTPRLPEPNSGRLRSYAVYRGMVSRQWALLTSLDSLGTPAVASHTKGHLEEHLFRNFMRYSRPHLPVAPANEWEFLVVAQHYGLPTRLLDWTTSPLVAAHFATSEGDPAEDRVIWRLDWKQVHEHFGLPNRALMMEDLHGVLSDKGVRSIWDLFKGTGENRDLFVCMLEPPALDARIVAQSAAFTLCSNKLRSLDEILVETGLARVLTRFVIPCGSVELIRDQLDLCSIDERRLFPDLQGLTAEMRRYYSSSMAQAAQLAQQK